jgi:hypothetical protein
MTPAFTDAEFLEWAKTKPQTETFDGTDNYACPIAQFLRDTERADSPYVLSEEWHDEALLTKKGRPSVVNKLPTKSMKASVSIHPVNTFAHIVCRLELLLAKRDMNDYYFEMRA